ncbi:hypothetical protein RFI_26310, partial [Reticulomyxa filosa]
KKKKKKREDGLIAFVDNFESQLKVEVIKQHVSWVRTLFDQFKLLDHRLAISDAEYTMLKSKLPAKPFRLFQQLVGVDRRMYELSNGTKVLPYTDLTALINKVIEDLQSELSQSIPNQGTQGTKLFQRKLSQQIQGTQNPFIGSAMRGFSNPPQSQKDEDDDIPGLDDFLANNEDKGREENICCFGIFVRLFFFLSLDNKKKIGNFDVNKTSSILYVDIQINTFLILFHAIEELRQLLKKDELRTKKKLCKDCDIVQFKDELIKAKKTQCELDNIGKAVCMRFEHLCKFKDVVLKRQQKIEFDVLIQIIQLYKNIIKSNYELLTKRDYEFDELCKKCLIIIGFVRSFRNIVQKLKTTKNKKKTIDRFNN